MKLDPDWTKTLDEIKALWPKWGDKANVTQLDEWTEALGRQNQAVVRLAVSRHYRECNFAEPRLSAVLKLVAQINNEKGERQLIDVIEAKRIALAKHDSRVQLDQEGMRRELMAFPGALRLEFLEIARYVCSKHLGEEAFKTQNADLATWSDAAVGLAWAAMKSGVTLEDAKSKKGRLRVAELAQEQVALLGAGA